MNDQTQFEYQERSAPPSAPGPPARVMPDQYKFSQDELRVLGECNSESFLQRSLPIGTGLGMGTLIAVQKGYLKPNPRFGAFPKVTLAVVIGYFVGKMSYQQKCAEKLMALPDSYIGQLLREKRDGRSGGRVSYPTPTPPMLGANPSDIYSDAGPGESLVLDLDRPIFSDDSYRPDNQTSPEVPTNTPELSYEELRRKNRGDFADSKQDPYRLDPSLVPPVKRAQPRHVTPPSTNKYGDEME